MPDLIRKQLPTTITPVGDHQVQLVVSTGAIDRDGDTIDPNGWHLDAFRKNPVVLWAHDYSSLPVAKCVDIQVRAGQLGAVAEFPTAELYPFGDQVYKHIHAGFLTGFSVGFRPLVPPTDNGAGGQHFSEQELLEFSAVPVPANADSLVVSRALRPTDAGAVWKWLGLAVDEPIIEILDDEPVIEIIDEPYLDARHRALHRRARLLAKGVSPPDVSTTIETDLSTRWSAPSLGDFTTSVWEDLSEADQRRVAGHYAWSAALPPDKFADLKLPHHSPKTHKVIWNGLTNCAARLNQTDLPAADVAKIKAHLRRHYKAFGKDIPDVLGAAFDPVARSGRVLSERNAEHLTRAHEHLDAAHEHLTHAKRHVADVLAEAGAAAGSGSKAGRVLSGENERALRAAHAHVETAHEHAGHATVRVHDVLSAARAEPDGAPDNDDTPISLPDAEAVAAALGEATVGALEELVHEQVGAVVAKMRGRVE